MIQEETEDVVAKAPARGHLARGLASRGRGSGPLRALRRVGHVENPFSFSKELVNSFLI